MKTSASAAVFLFFSVVVTMPAFADIVLTEHTPVEVHTYDNDRCALFLTKETEKRVCIRGENIRPDDYKETMPELERGFSAIIDKAPGAEYSFEEHLVLPDTIRVYFFSSDEVGPYFFGEGDSLKSAISDLIGKQIEDKKIKLRKSKNAV